MPFGSEGRVQGIGLALSGGGFRAVLFHCGALLRLNEASLLTRLDRISSVSGGSIVAGVLATRWSSMRQSEAGVIEDFVPQVVEPLRTLCSSTLDAGVVISGALNPFKTAGEELRDAYRERLGLGVKLSTLVDKPRFVFNSTNYATGVSFRFSKPYCGDYRIGLIREHNFDVATAVACSSAFPPVLAPFQIDVHPGAFEPTEHADLYEREDFRRRLLLADGGVYDNLGLETVWGRYSTLLVSDGGKPFELDAGPSMLAFKELGRVMDIGLNQALALRKRMLISAYKSRDEKLRGTYWGIATRIAKFGLPDATAISEKKIAQLASIRTRLNRFSEQEQEELINWGYAVSDAAVRAHLPDVPLPKPQPPFPTRALN